MSLRLGSVQSPDGGLRLGAVQHSAVTQYAPTEWDGSAVKWDGESVFWFADGVVIVSRANLQGARQAAVRTDTGTALDYNSDMLTLMKSDLSVTSGDYNSLLIQWLQFKLSSASTSLHALMQEAANDRGVDTWQEITDPTAIGT